MYLIGGWPFRIPNDTNRNHIWSIQKCTCNSNLISTGILKMFKYRRGKKINFCSIANWNCWFLSCVICSMQGTDFFFTKSTYGIFYCLVIMCSYMQVHSLFYWLVTCRMCHFVRIENKIKLLSMNTPLKWQRVVWNQFGVVLNFQKLAKVFDSRLRTFTLSICSKDHNELFFGSIDLCVVRIKRLTKKNTWNLYRMLMYFLLFPVVHVRSSWIEKLQKCTHLR